MAILGIDRRQGRRYDRKYGKQQEAYEDAYKKEQERLEEERRKAQQAEVFATTEGQGIMEGATISLGFEEEELDEFGNPIISPSRYMNTGLVI